MQKKEKKNKVRSNIEENMQDKQKFLNKLIYEFQIALLKLRNYLFKYFILNLSLYDCSI